MLNIVISAFTAVVKTLSSEILELKLYKQLQEGPYAKQ